MTLARSKTETLTQNEWDELVALKNAINDDPASVHYTKMEQFSEYLVRILREKGG